MGKKVTYGIKLAEKSNIPTEISKHISKYKTLLSENQPIKAAKIVINITEWVLDASEEVEDPEDEKIEHYLSYVIKYSTRAVELLNPDEHNNLLFRAHNNMCQCYLKLNTYSSAIQHGLITISLYNQQSAESRKKSNLQNAYKILGDIYFTKSLDKEESRFKDFENAHKYYTLEKEVIDIMDLNDIINSEPDDIKRLKQASHFNLGVMETKISALHVNAEKNLREAITLAHKLKDFAAEKNGWWELGNLYKRTEQPDNVKFCQNEEFNVTRRNNFKEDLFYCFEEKLKYLLYLEEYEECFQFYHKAIASISPTYIKQCKHLYIMMESLKSAKDELSQFIDMEDRNVPMASIFIEHIQTLNDYKLYRCMIKKVDEYVSLILSASDYSSVIHAEFLKYKLIALWNLRESKKDVYIRNSDELLEFIETSLTDKKLDQLTLTIEVLRLRIEIFTFYDKKIQQDTCKKLLTEIIQEKKTMVESFPSNSNMDIDTNITNRIIPLFNSFAPKVVNITVLTKPPIDLSIRYQSEPKSVKKIMSDIAKKCWDDHGVEPIISHLYTSGRNIYPADNVDIIMRQDRIMLKAFIDKIVYKTPLQLYQNAAARLEMGQLNAIKTRLSKQKTPTKLELDNLYIAFEQKKLAQPILQHSTSLKVLDLSSNCLDDQDLEFLLKNAHKGLTELRLRNNLLTVNCLSSVILFPHLRVLDLSYNALGPAILQQLPNLIENLPDIEEIVLSSTKLGNFVKIDENIKEAYITLRMASSINFSLTLDFSNNHFDRNMLHNWTKLWVNLDRIAKLRLSNISSDTQWDNFTLLSDLPNLSDLILGFSSKKTFYLCDFQQLVTLKTALNFLDLSCCNLKAEHVEKIAQSMKENDTTLGKLALHGNPRIGDNGVFFLNSVVLQSKINVLDISDCDITNESKPELIQWTHYLQEIDLTENNLAFDYQEMGRLNKLTNIKLSCLKDSVFKVESQEFENLSIESYSGLPDTPFN